MMQCLIRKLAALSQYEEVLAKISSTSTDRLTVLKTKPQSIQRDIITVCNDPYTLAQQLTHIELVRLLSSLPFTTTDLLCFGNQTIYLSTVMSTGEVRIIQVGNHLRQLKHTVFMDLSMNASDILGIRL